MQSQLGSLLDSYMEKTSKQDKGVIAYLAALDHLMQKSPEVAKSILNELGAQKENLKLIASENFCSLSVQLAMGNILTDKYAEGYVNHRFYAGCENVDAIEDLANGYLKKIFQVDHAYCQPHSGADANLVAFLAILFHKIQTPLLEKAGKKLQDLTVDEMEQIRQILLGQKLLGMGLASGGHLTHGYRHNISSKLFQSFSYEVNPESGLLDYDEIAKRAKEVKPLVLIAGYSAYSRLIDFAKMKQIAQENGAVFMVDMAHFSGLVAAKTMTGNFNPAPFADILTSTTHKTLRGPRGGFVLCSDEFKDEVDRGCPMVLGGPLPHVIAAKAIAFSEALDPSFALYGSQVIQNAKALAEELMKLGVKVITDGTDNHLIVFDVFSSFGLTGRQAELALKESNITANRNMIPADSQGAWYTSGVRIGTAALTTLGMKTAEMKMVAHLIVDVLKSTKAGQDPKTQKISRARFDIDAGVMQRVKSEVKELLCNFPLYPELKLD